MRRSDIILWYIADAITTCIILRNMCTNRKDKFDIKWIE